MRPGIPTVRMMKRSAVPALCSGPSPTAFDELVGQLMGEWPESNRRSRQSQSCRCAALHHIPTLAGKAHIPAVAGLSRLSSICP